MKTKEEIESLKEKEKQEELIKKIDSIIENEFKKAIENAHPKLSSFKISKAGNIQHAICFHDIDPLFYTSKQNPVNDIVMKRSLSYREDDMVIKAFVYGQCFDCGKIYYFPTNEFVGYILKTLNLV